MRVFVLLQIVKNQPVNCVGVFGGYHAALSMIPRNRESEFICIEHILDQPTKISTKCKICDDTGFILNGPEDDYLYSDCPNGCEG